MKYHNRERRTGSRHGSHISLFKMFSRAVLAIVMSLGFGAFWYALAAGIYENVFLFTFGISIIAIGFLHIFIGMRKDVTHRKSSI